MGRLLMNEELISKCLNLYAKSGHTKSAYKTDLMKIKKYLDEKKISLDELKHEDIKLFFNEYEKKYATESVNRCKNSIKFFISYLVKNRYLSVDAEIIVSDLERKIPDNKQEKYLDMKQINYFLGFLKDAPRQRGEQVSNFDFLRARDTMMFTLFITRGLRSTEMSRLQLNHFDIEKKIILIPKVIRKNGNTKHGLDLTVLLDDNLIDLYTKYLTEREKISTDNNYIFLKPNNGNPMFTFKDGEFTAGGIMSEILRRRIKQCNMYHLICNSKGYIAIEDMSIHALRHTATYYLRKEYALNNYEMANTLGQKSIQSQKRYSHVNQEDLREKLNSM